MENEILTNEVVEEATEEVINKQSHVLRNLGVIGAVAVIGALSYKAIKHLKKRKETENVNGNDEVSDDEKIIEGKFEEVVDEN